MGDLIQELLAEAASFRAASVKVEGDSRAADLLERAAEALSGPPEREGKDSIESVYGMLLSTVRRTAPGGPEANENRQRVALQGVEALEAEWPAAWEQYRKRWY